MSTDAGADDSGDLLQEALASLDATAAGSDLPPLPSGAAAGAASGAVATDDSDDDAGAGVLRAAMRQDAEPPLHPTLPSEVPTHTEPEPFGHAAVGAAVGAAAQGWFGRGAPLALTPTPKPHRLTPGLNPRPAQSFRFTLSEAGAGRDAHSGSNSDGEHETEHAGAEGRVNDNGSAADGADWRSSGSRLFHARASHHSMSHSMAMAQLLAEGESATVDLEHGHLSGGSSLARPSSAAVSSAGAAFTSAAHDDMLWRAKMRLWSVNKWVLVLSATDFDCSDNIDRTEAWRVGYNLTKNREDAEALAGLLPTASNWLRRLQLFRQPAGEEPSHDNRSALLAAARRLHRVARVALQSRPGVRRLIAASSHDGSSARLHGAATSPGRGRFAARKLARWASAGGPTNHGHWRGRNWEDLQPWEQRAYYLVFHEVYGYVVASEFQRTPQMPPDVVVRFSWSLWVGRWLFNVLLIRAWVWATRELYMQCSLFVKRVHCRGSGRCPCALRRSTEGTAFMLVGTLAALVFVAVASAVLYPAVLVMPVRFIALWMSSADWRFVVQGRPLVFYALFMHSTWCVALTTVEMNVKCAPPNDLVLMPVTDCDGVPTCRAWLQVVLWGSPTSLLGEATHGRLGHERRASDASDVTAADAVPLTRTSSAVGVQPAATTAPAAATRTFGVDALETKAGAVTTTTATTARATTPADSDGGGTAGSESAMGASTAGGGAESGTGNGYRRRWGITARARAASGDSADERTRRSLHHDHDHDHHHPHHGMSFRFQQAKARMHWLREAASKPLPRGRKRWCVGVILFIMWLAAVLYSGTRLQSQLSAAYTIAALPDEHFGCQTLFGSGTNAALEDYLRCEERRCADGYVAVEVEADANQRAGPVPLPFATGKAIWNELRDGIPDCVAGKSDLRNMLRERTRVSAVVVGDVSSEVCDPVFVASSDEACRVQMLAAVPDLGWPWACTADDMRAHLTEPLLEDAMHQCLARTPQVNCSILAFRGAFRHVPNIERQSWQGPEGDVVQLDESTALPPGATVMDAGGPRLVDPNAPQSAEEAGPMRAIICVPSGDIRRIAAPTRLIGAVCDGNSSTTCPYAGRYCSCSTDLGLVFGRQWLWITDVQWSAVMVTAFFSLSALFAGVLAHDVTQMMQRSSSTARWTRLLATVNSRKARQHDLPFVPLDSPENVRSWVEVNRRLAYITTLSQLTPAVALASSILSASAIAVVIWDMFSNRFDTTTAIATTTAALAMPTLLFIVRSAVGVSDLMATAHEELHRVQRYIESVKYDLDERRRVARTRFAAAVSTQAARNSVHGAARSSLVAAAAAVAAREKRHSVHEDLEHQARVEEMDLASGGRNANEDLRMHLFRRYKDHPDDLAYFSEYVAMSVNLLGSTPPAVQMFGVRMEKRLLYQVMVATVTTLSIAGVEAILSR